jgi:uncharacterized protein (TIGR03066 family)
MKAIPSSSVSLCVVVIFLVGIAAEAVGDAPPKVKDLIIGKWRAQQTLKDKDDKQVKLTTLAEFTADGKLKYEHKHDEMAKTLEGTYKILDEKTIETTIKEVKKTVTHKLSIETLTKTKLILVGEKAERIEFDRVK